MKRDVLPIMFLALALSFTPLAQAYRSGIDCPPHPDHCRLDPIELPDGTVVAAQAEVEAEVTAATSGQIFVQVGASAKVVVTLTINSTPTGNRSVEATVIVNETAGMQFSGLTTKAATVTPSTPAVFEFEFETDEDLAEGDVLFIPVLVQAESLTTSGFAPFTVGSATPPPPDVLLPIITGLLGLGTGSGLTWAALRRP